MLSSILGSRSKHLPPSPPGRFLLGNLKDIPSTEQWMYFYDQSQKYGSDVNAYHILNKTLIVLNSHKAIDALFTKQVEHYSNKPPRKMSHISDLTTTLPFMNPGTVFSAARKQFHLGLGPAAVHAYDADYERGSRRFLGALAADLECGALERSIDDSLGHIFLKVSTGYDGPQTESILQQMNSLAHFAADVLGDKYKIFDVVPGLSWLPTGTPYVGPMLKLGQRWKTQLHATAATTVKIMQESKEQGKSSVMSATYSSSAATDDKDDRSSMIAVTMNAGGMLATESATLTFLLAMAKFPDIQKRAQAEVDRVTATTTSEGEKGKRRLPTMADRASLPYVDAVLAEVLRWVSIAPVIAREVVQDDHYDGYLIPKGATIMANNWAISRDATIYPDPETFRPERFLSESEPGKTPTLTLRTDILHPMQYAFGFGHRTCPGRFLADALLFSHFAHVLAVFDVSLPSESPSPSAHAEGTDGGAGGRGQEQQQQQIRKERAADEKMKVKSNGAACRVEEVYVRLAPRSEEAAALIAQCAGQ